MTEALSVTVNPIRVSVDPGGTAELTLQLRNHSPVVDEYAVEILGEAATWTTLDRTRVPTYPNTTEMVHISIHPPHESSPLAGTVPVGVRVRSSVDPELAVIEECQVVIKPFVEIDAEIKPTTANGRFSANHRLRVVNHGNAPVSVSIRAKVQQGDCDVAVPPGPIVVAAGGRATTKVTVRPTGTHLRGGDEMHSYRLNLVPEGGAPVAIDAMMRQRPILRVPTAVLVTLALLLGGAYVAYGKGPNPVQQILQQRGLESASKGSNLPAGPSQSVSSPTIPQSSPVPASFQAQPPSSGPSCTVGTPTNVMAISGNGQATVQWVAPPPSCAITGYTIVGSPGPIRLNAGAMDVSIVVPRLINGTTYSFYVVASGATGTGAASPPSNPVIPVGPPGPPVGVAATAGDTTATVTWGVPANTGGAPITAYLVSISPAQGAVSISTTPSGGIAFVSSLSNNVIYTFSVTAVNKGGTGPPASSGAVTPRCTAVNTLLLSVSSTTLYFSARGTCSPYSGTVTAYYISIFGVRTQASAPFAAGGSNPSGSIPWGAPFGTSHTSFTVTLTDSRGISVTRSITYN